MDAPWTPPAMDPQPLIASVAMGYGHLRAAHSLASAIGSEVVHADRPPLAGADELRLWKASRRLYEATSRASQVPVLGAPLRPFLESLTHIPHLHPRRDLSRPTFQVRSLHRLVEKGLGRGLAERLRETGQPLLTTFFASAIAAAHHGGERVYCVVTDSDVNRSWAPLRPDRTQIVYLAPSRRAERRLRAYGVPRERIEFTGFPLPHGLLGGPELPACRRNLAARLARLDRRGAFRGQAGDEIHPLFGGELPAAEEGRPPLVTYAVGGAGAQAGLAREILQGLRPAIEQRRLRLCLVAGVREEVAESFHRWIREAGLEGHLGEGVRVLAEPSLPRYFARFDELLAETDALWTKPSEMTFYAALGLPLILSPPVGVHERYNRRWAMENGPGLEQRDPCHAGDWLREWLDEGTLAAAAWYGFLRLPKLGLYRILERVAGRERSGV
jgi:hypothetical protein